MRGTSMSKITWRNGCAVGENHPRDRRGQPRRGDGAQLRDVMLGRAAPGGNEISRRGARSDR